MAFKIYYYYYNYFIFKLKGVSQAQLLHALVAKEAEKKENEAERKRRQEEREEKKAKKNNKAKKKKTTRYEEEEEEDNTNDEGYNIGNEDKVNTIINAYESSEDELADPIEEEDEAINFPMYNIMQLNAMQLYFVF